jgi:uncharacterized protein (DUF952 family)
MIYRIAESADWQNAIDTGFFASADLAQEGFIHCSEKHQILRTATKYYTGKNNLKLIEIDDSKIAAHIKREDSTGRGEKFPHAYSPIPLTAIKRDFDFVALSAGFVMPF